MEKHICIGLDFDGTVCKHVYPEIGEEVPHAIRVLHRLIQNNIKIVLNTMRSDVTLEQAVDYLKDRNVALYGINRHPEQDAWTSSPKVYAHFYIDDAAIGCPLIFSKLKNERPYVDWLVVERLLEAHNILPTQVRTTK